MIVLYDTDATRSRAAAEDLGHAAAFSYDVKITAANNYRAIRGSDIVIISAGANQKPGETRMDLLQKNCDGMVKASNFNVVEKNVIGG